jgi:2-iminobutanoate/2-iminopropanoate deaminase
MFRTVVATAFCLAASSPGVAQSVPAPASVEFLKPSGALPSNLPFSEGVTVGNLVLLSGQIGNVPGTLKLNNATADDEFRQVMDNVMGTLKANGLGARNVVKCTVMLADMKDWGAFNKIYQTYFEPPYPARSAFGANGLAVGARVEVECIAAR